MRTDHEIKRTESDDPHISDVENPRSHRSDTRVYEIDHQSIVHDAINQVADSP